MRSLVALALVAAVAGCAHRGTPNANPDPQPVVGTYRLAGINHRALPTTSPTEPNVTVYAGQLTLDRGNGYVLQLWARNAPQLPALERVMRGSYSVAGNTLSFSATESGGGSTTWRYFSAGGRLSLKDQRGNQFDFVLR